MLIFASEDVGNADPQALILAPRRRRGPRPGRTAGGRLNLTQAAIYLALAPKSKASYIAIGPRARRCASAEPPAVRGRCATLTTLSAKKLGHGTGFSIDPHSDPRGSRSNFLPEELKGRRYYHPSGNERGSRPGWRRSRRGVRHRSSTSRSAAGARAARRLPRQAQRPARLPPLAFTPVCTEEEALDLQEKPDVVRERRHGRRPSPATRPAGLEGKAQAQLHARLRLLAAGEACAYGVFDETRGTPIHAARS